MNALERLRAVLCAPDGDVVIDGTDSDRSIVSEALKELEAALALSRGVPEVIKDRSDEIGFDDGLDAPAADGAQSEGAVLFENVRGHVISELNKIARRIVNVSPNVSEEVEQLAAMLVVGATEPLTPPAPQPAAADGGVRERAREILAGEVASDYPKMARALVAGKSMESYVLVPHCLRAIEAALSSHRQAGESNGKLVGWWNGIMPDVTERSPYGPSVRWGADAENSGHDIPLYDGYNPIHYTAPPLSKFRELAERWRELSVKSHRDGQYQGYDTLRLCADDLLALVEKGAGNG